MELVHNIQHADIVHRCFRCGYCKFPSDYSDFNCPSYKAVGWDTYSPGGRMWLIRGWMEGEIKTNSHFAEIMYACAACDNCKNQCVFPRFRDFLPEIFEETRAELVNEGFVPPPVRDYFKAVTINGNPYKLPQERRGDWAAGTGIQKFSGHEYLLYIGSVGAWDEIGQKMTRSVARVLIKAGVSVGILADEETCDGNDVKAMGETGLFKQLATDNIIKFKEKGIGKIITLDPHAYNAFKKDYPPLGADFQVFHHTQIMAELLKEKRITPSTYPVTVTYHDPCYLGRHNAIYGPPRDILKAIPGLALVEMRQSGVNGFCCGGGGGNFFTDILGSGEDSPGRVRVRQALQTGASVIAVACPNCAKMLCDAVKAEGLEEILRVQGIAEIIEQASL
ncbi:MAG: (Fe-S)-binding protein [Syntrophales bacterium]